MWQTVRDMQPRSKSLNHSHLSLAAFAALVLQGCAVQPGSTQSAAQDEMLAGKSQTCTASIPDFKAGASAEATIAMTNDGWCGVSATDKDGKPFQLALIGTRPTHGRVFTQSVAGRTRVEYTPYARFSGADAFSVTMRPVGGGADQTLQVAVSVIAGAAPAVAEPAPRTATTPAKRRPVAPRRTTPAR